MTEWMCAICFRKLECKDCMNPNNHECRCGSESWTEFIRAPSLIDPTEKLKKAMCEWLDIVEERIRKIEGKNGEPFRSE